MSNASGLDVRLATMIVRTLLHFESSVRAEANEESADGRSLLGLISLCVACGTEIKFIATGRDAAPALTAVQRRLARQFGERPAPETPSRPLAEEGEALFLDHPPLPANQEFLRCEQY
jgi:phosphotransferase system HPr (HPr) family protein